MTIPFEERPSGCRDVLWRFSANPVIPRDAIPTSNSIFNSAVVPFKDGFAGVFRCDNKARVQDCTVDSARTAFIGTSTPHRSALCVTSRKSPNSSSAMIPVSALWKTGTM